MASPSLSGGNSAFPNYNATFAHIEDPNERRRRALAQIDTAPFGWRHARAVVVAGVGFFTDSYDIFAINLCSAMLGVVYWQTAATRPGKIPYSADTAVKVSTSAGTVVGQLLFGWLADRIGRKRIFATTKHRGAMMAAVFAMQGFGPVRRRHGGARRDGRFSGFARVGCLGEHVLRRMPARRRQDVARDYRLRRGAGLPRAVLPSEDPRDPAVLLGTAGSWFFLDVAFYGLGLNNSLILSAIGWSGGSTVYEYFYRNAVGNLILICAGSIPGYWMTVATVDTLGRKPIQLGGFIILTIVFIVIGFAYEPLKHSHNGLLALYVVAQFFFNFGPNATTFIVPGECFPTRYRSTSHGISAASGKIGAIIAQCVFGPLAHKGATGGKESSDTPWLNHVMQIFALFMLCGCFTSLLIPETKRKTLESMADEETEAASEGGSHAGSKNGAMLRVGEREYTSYLRWYNVHHILPLVPVAPTATDHHHLPQLIAMQPTPPLTTRTTTDETEIISSLRLIADSIAQQRQTAARRFLTHPLYLTVLTFALYLVYRLVYHGPDDRGTLLTTWSGCLMASLLVAQYQTARYIEAAERTGTFRWLFQGDDTSPMKPADQPEYDLSSLPDHILVTTLGDEIIGTLILRPERRANPGAVAAGEDSGHGGDETVGAVRAWTVRRKYRGLGVGRELWAAAAEICRREKWEGPQMARWHANAEERMYSV
ncbi:inorganic phosphate transporter PHO84 [Aspergillus terreus NIH2624]|uniref:Inorganic phosphate transporter PHO84 n=1 Tax=Aspergillus terreus (strain NIH 2624 / FGSC A1156) TaxID=341663 RepID=Q0CVX0_ASPTN|nr:inorganic phosphate transporter PHO84 [Aspergillus terreus NIH2624]EAU37126.1 inorganic phosphate transporter PHO84 [Aspergillus terreus NIH2624]